MWLRNISNRLIALYFSSVTEACKDNHEKLFRTFFLMRPSRLFHIAVSLCCQLKASLTDDIANAIIEQNLIFSICGLHGLLQHGEYANLKYWSELEHTEQGLLLRTFHQLDSRKGRSMFASLTSGIKGQDDRSTIHLPLNFTRRLTFDFHKLYKATIAATMAHGNNNEIE